MSIQTQLLEPRQQFTSLLIIRALILSALWLTWSYCLWQTQLQLPYTHLASVLAVLSFINALSLIRLKNPLPVTSSELLIQLLIDILGLSLLFYASGGGSNPFIFYFLVPISIAAASLKKSHAWLITGLAVTAYSLLMFYHQETESLAPISHHSHQQNSAHLIGMWLNFFVSALLINLFIARLAEHIRQQHKAIIRHQEGELRNNQILAVATLAAGTAHELSTPLSTMRLVVNDLLEDYPSEKFSKDLSLLDQQITLCTKTLKALNNSSHVKNHVEKTLCEISEFCTQVIEQWLLMRPDVSLKQPYQLPIDSLTCLIDPTITQALTNLLNNAADACPEQISISCSVHHHILSFTIKDCGEGITPQIATQLGMPVESNKHTGLGIGLMITQSTIERLGGQLILTPQKPKGTITQVQLPLTVISMVEK